MSQRVDGLSCENVLVRLEPLIDGEFSVDEAAAISAHIEICANCSEELILAKRIRAELRGLPELDTPDRVLRAVRWETGGRSPLDRAGRDFPTHSPAPNSDAGGGRCSSPHRADRSSSAGPSGSGDFG